MVTSLLFPLATLRSEYAMKPAPTPFEIEDRLEHEPADEHQRRGRGLRRNNARDGCEEDRNEEERRSHEAREPRLGALRDTRARLDVGRVARRTEDAAEQRAERVDPEDAVGAIDRPVLLQPAALGRH